MSFWKILGGAALGVGAVAAAPFTGGGSLLGAATLAGSLAGAGAIAAGAGTVGAAAGAAYSSHEAKKAQKQKQNDFNAGKRQAETENAIAMEKLKQEIINLLNENVQREQFIICSFAVGICCANADGNICDNEKEELEILVAGIGMSDTLAKTTKDKIEEMYITPPNLNSVWALINEHGLNEKKHLDIYNQIINYIVEVDGNKCDSEKEFIDAWNSLAA